MSEFEELYNSYYKDVYYFVLKLTDYQEHITEEVLFIAMENREVYGFGFR